MASRAPGEIITLETQGKIAIITINNPGKLNALDQGLYYHLAQLMREVAARDDIYITILTGKGRFFSAYVPSHAFIPPPSSLLLFPSQLTRTRHTQRRRCIPPPRPSPRHRPP